MVAPENPADDVIVDVPAAVVQKVPDLERLEFFNTSFVDFSFPARDIFGSLKAIRIAKSPMTEWPPNLMELPMSTTEVSLSYLPQLEHAPPTEVRQRFPYVVRMFLDYNALTSIPSTFRLNKLRILSMAGNQMTEFGMSSARLNVAFLQNNRLESVPTFKRNNVQIAFCSNNLIESPPDDTFETTYVLTDNPVCQSMPDAFDCSESNHTCPFDCRKFLNSNSHRNLECNTTSCAYDGGDCL